MKKLFSKNGAFPKKAMIVGVALAVVVALSYFGSSDYLGQSIMDMLMGGTADRCKCKDGYSAGRGCPCDTRSDCNGVEDCSPCGWSGCGKFCVAIRSSY